MYQLFRGISIGISNRRLHITLSTLSQPKTCNRSRGPPNPPRGRVETVPYYLPDSLHGDPSKREPGVRCVEVPIHPSGPELRRPRARVERCVRWGCRHARENTGIYRSVTGVRGRKTLGAPFRRKQNKTKQENTDRVERTFRSAPVGTGVTEWYRKGSDRRDGGCAWFSPHPHGRASTARPLYGGRGAAILPVRACVSSS